MGWQRSERTAGTGSASVHQAARRKETVSAGRAPRFSKAMSYYVAARQQEKKLKQLSKEHKQRAERQQAARSRRNGDPAQMLLLVGQAVPVCARASCVGNTVYARDGEPP